MKWPTVTLGEICEFKYGKALPAAKRDGGQYPVFGSNGVVGHHSSSITDSPCIVIGRKGSFGEVHYSATTCWPIDTTYYVDSTSTDADLKWLSYRLNGLGLTELNRAAAIPGLNREDAYRQQLLLPPLDEQRRIAAVLDHADRLRIKQGDALHQFDALRSAIFTEMFGDPVSNPKAWPMYRLEDQVESLQYGPRFHNESYSAQGIRIVRITDLDYYGRLNFDAMPLMEVSDADRAKFSLRPGDIIFARTGATVGKLALIEPDAPPCIAGAYFIRIQVRNGIEPQYVAALLRTPAIQSIIVAGSHQSAQQNFSGPGLRALPVPFPPADLQRRFGALTSSLTQRRFPLAQRRQHLDELFASLQSRAFRGEL